MFHVSIKNFNRREEKYVFKKMHSIKNKKKNV